MIPQDESIQDFCLKNKVPYNLFHKWYKDARHHIVPVQINGQQVEQELEKSLSVSAPSMGGALTSHPVRFMIDIHMTEQLLSLNENSQTKMIDKLKRMLSDHDALIEKLRKKIAALKEQKKLSSKRHDFDSREADKDDFDGSSTPDLPPEDTKTDIPSSVEKKEGLPYRKGMFYNRMIMCRPPVIL